MTRISGVKILAVMLASVSGLYFWTYFQLINLHSINVFFYSVLAFLILAVPALYWIITQKHSFYRVPIPALWALAIIINLGMSGFITQRLFDSALDMAVHDTYLLEVSHQQTLWLSAIFVFFAIITYWFKKSPRFQYNVLLAHLHFWLFVGGSLVFIYWIPIFSSMGMPKRYVNYAQDYERLNVLSQIGAGLAIAGLAAFVFWFARALMTIQKSTARIEANQ